MKEITRSGVDFSALMTPRLRINGNPCWWEVMVFVIVTQGEPMNWNIYTTKNIPRFYHYSLPFFHPFKISSIIHVECKPGWAIFLQKKTIELNDSYILNVPWKSWKSVDQQYVVPPKLSYRLQKSQADHLNIMRESNSLVKDNCSFKSYDLVNREGGGGSRPALFRYKFNELDLIHLPLGSSESSM